MLSSLHFAISLSYTPTPNLLLAERLEEPAFLLSNKFLVLFQAFPKKMILFLYTFCFVIHQTCRLMYSNYVAVVYIFLSIEQL